MNKYYIFLVLLIPRLAFGAVVFDSVATVSDSGFSGTSHTHTVGGGCTNPVVIVAVHWYYDQTVSAVTVGGSAATPIGSTVTAPGGATRLEMWQRVGVSTGSNTVATTFSGPTSIWVISRSYCGVDQATPSGTPASASGANTAPTVNVTSAAGELVVDAVAMDTLATTLTVGSGQTQRANFGSLLTGASEETGATTVTMSWSLDSSDDWVILGVSLKPAAPPSGAPVARRVVIVQ